MRRGVEARAGIEGGIKQRLSCVRRHRGALLFGALVASSGSSGFSVMS